MTGTLSLTVRVLTPGSDELVSAVGGWLNERLADALIAQGFVPGDAQGSVQIEFGRNGAVTYTWAHVAFPPGTAGQFLRGLAEDLQSAFNISVTPG